MRYLSPVLGVQFMNLGYWPTETSKEQDREVKIVVEQHSSETDLHRPHYYLYERSLKAHPDYPLLCGLQVLEVGCGQGNGMNWIKKAHSRIKSVQGIDRCALGGTCIVLGDAHHLPYGNHQFDIVINASTDLCQNDKVLDWGSPVNFATEQASNPGFCRFGALRRVLNVESSHLYHDCEQFFRECARVLKKDGYLCWVDLRYRTQVNETRRQAVRAGFVEERWEDVTENIIMGIERTAARYDKILLKAPAFIRMFSSSLRATYCAPGTHTYARFVNNEKGYYAALWRNN